MKSFSLTILESYLKNLDSHSINSIVSAEKRCKETAIKNLLGRDNKDRLLLIFLRNMLSQEKTKMI